MELITFNKSEYKRIEVFRIMTGVVAIFVAVLNAFEVISEFRFFDILGISYVVISILVGLFVIGAMISIAIFAFAYYGKKKTSLWGISAFLMATSQLLIVLLSIINVSGYSESAVSFDTIMFIFTGFITPLLSSVIFLLIGYAWFRPGKINIKVLPIILIFLSVLSGLVSRIIIPILHDTFFSIFILMLVLGLMYIVPYLLFLSFCPQTHKRVKTDSSNSHIQEQEVMIGDLNFQLTSLKRDFENGKITKHEFEFRRKSLIDKL